MIAVWAPVLMIPSLFVGFLCYALYLENGFWRVLAPVVFVAALLDVLANYTELALLTWDWPRPGEHTFSQRLYRLCQDPNRWGCIATAKVLNYFVPGHIKGVS